MRNQRERILNMPEAIERIERYAARGRTTFESDELIQTWVVHHLQSPGEAAARLGREFHQAYGQGSWPEIVAMRNILVHEYFGIDLEEVWQTVKEALPRLKAGLQDVLASLR